MEMLKLRFAETAKPSWVWVKRDDALGESYYGIPKAYEKSEKDEKEYLIRQNKVKCTKVMKMAEGEVNRLVGFLSYNLTTFFAHLFEK